MPKALGTASSGTIRSTVAVDNAQKPPIATPRKALAIINQVKPGAKAMTTSEMSISRVIETRT
ncbi:hypothetical protein D3C76_1278820 [compost metagenome]